MELAWCCKCHTDVSLARAVAELPCPRCGATTYFLIAGDAERDALLSESERMMRIGRWPEAKRALLSCSELGLISVADYNLSFATLEWRKNCVEAAIGMISARAVPLSDFREALAKDYDKFVIGWVLREFRGIRLVPDGGSYLVEVRAE